MKDNLTSGVWWKAAVLRALRTALVIAVPYVPTTLFTHAPLESIGGAVGLGFVLSILTSVAGLSEASGVVVTWYFAALERVVKTVAQALVAGIGTAALLQDVHWTAITGSALASGLGTLLLAVIAKLPEAGIPLAAASAVNNVYVSAPVVSPAPAVDAPAPVVDAPAPVAPVAEDIPTPPVAEAQPAVAPSEAAPASADPAVEAPAPADTTAAPEVK